MLKFTKNKWKLAFCLVCIILSFIFLANFTYAAQLQDLVNLPYEQTSLVDFLTKRAAFQTLWRAMVGLLDILVFISFIVMALANVFHIKYDQYQVQKALPGLIVGIIFANLSFSICLFFIRFVEFISFIFIGSPEQFAHNMACLYSWVWVVAATVGAIGLASLGTGFSLILLALFLALLPALFIIVIAGILWLRAFVILVLVAFSPWAFFLSFFPIEIPFLTEQAKKFIPWFSRFLIIGPLMFIILWVAFTLHSAARNPTNTSSQTNVPAATSNQTNTSATNTRDTAIKLCQQEKAKYSEDNWNKGPCLTNNLNGYAIDIAHSPRQAIDNNSSNQCQPAPSKFIELNLDCQIIREVAGKSNNGGGGEPVAAGNNLRRF